MLRFLTHDLNPALIRAVVRILIVLAAGGAASSLVGVALGQAGVQEMPAVLAAILGVLLVPTVAGLLAVSVGGLTDLPQRQRTKLMYAGCPLWLRRLVYGLMLFGAVNFFGRFALEAKGVVPTTELGFPSVTFSSFCLIVFAAGIGQMVSFLVLRARLDATRCLQGHPVPLEARFCPTCGAPITARLTAP